jgi:hypothetical protein
MRFTKSVRVSWDEAQRLHQQMDKAYGRFAQILRDRPADDEALGRAQAQADALGKRYERLCEWICRAKAATFEDVLVKLECAAQCIRNIVPDGTDPERACDIELRIVLVLERDVRRLVADARRDGASPGATPRNWGTILSARGKRLRDVGT